MIDCWKAPATLAEWLMPTRNFEQTSRHWTLISWQLLETKTWHKESWLVCPTCVYYKLIVAITHKSRVPCVKPSHMLMHFYDVRFSLANSFLLWVYYLYSDVRVIQLGFLMHLFLASERRLEYNQFLEPSYRLKETKLDTTDPSCPKMSSWR